MDFLDPKKTRAHNIRLLVGYVLLAIAIGLAVTILRYQAEGLGYRQGKIIQNGIVFVSSTPGGANIFLNGQKNRATTSDRLILPTGTYTMRLQRDGYRDWQRAVTIEGIRVDRFDYPLLIPSQLTTQTTSEYPSMPPLVTQSPDRRWLMVQLSAQSASFDVYDIRDTEGVRERKTTISLPANILELPQTGAQSFKLTEWSRDNNHLMLQHVVGDQSEYIMLSRDKPAESFNLTKKLQLNKTSVVTLQDKKYDRYFVHDTAAQTLSTASFANPVPLVLLNQVIDYKTYGNEVVLYATSEGAAEGKMNIKLLQNKKGYLVRQVAKEDAYLLDVSNYEGKWYVAVGAPGDDHVFIYRDVAERLRQNATAALVPADILKLDAPNYIEFSATSQFLMVENGQDIAVYDAEYNRSFNYKLDRPIDTPQVHLTWMDGFRLNFVSQGKVTILDYDGTNFQTLVDGNAAFLPLFDTGYETLYSVSSAKQASDQAIPENVLLTSTPLRTPRDR